MAAAIILAAGEGTRMKSDRPKVLHEVCGRPMLAYVLDACSAAGCDPLLAVIGHEAESVRDAFEHYDHKVTWVEQTEQRGTGHAVMCCGDHLAERSGPVLVLAGDGPLIRPQTLRKLLETHAREQASCTLATCVMPDPRRYGRILRGDNGRLVGIVEYLDADEPQRQIREVNVSLYCFDADRLRQVLPRLSNDNVKGEYYLTDTIALVRSTGGTLATVSAVDPREVLGINTVEELAEANRVMAERLTGDGANHDT